MSIPSWSNADQFNTDRVVLYQPDAVLQPRIKTAQALAEYIKRLQAICDSAFAKATRPEIIDIVVAVKPGKRSRVWFVSSRPSGDPELGALTVRLEQVEAMEVSDGPIAFAIAASIRGAKRPRVSDDAFQPPLPKEWQEAAARLTDPVHVPDDILRLIWP